MSFNVTSLLEPQILQIISFFEDFGLLGCDLCLWVSGSRRFERTIVPSFCQRVCRIIELKFVLLFELPVLSIVVVVVVVIIIIIIIIIIVIVEVTS